MVPNSGLAKGGSDRVLRHIADVTVVDLEEKKRIIPRWDNLLSSQLVNIYMPFPKETDFGK